MATRLQTKYQKRLQYRWHVRHREIEVALDDLRAWLYRQKRAESRGVRLEWPEGTRRLRQLHLQVAEFFRIEAWLSMPGISAPSDVADERRVASETHARQAAVDRFNVLTLLDELILRSERTPQYERWQPALHEFDELIDRLERHMDSEADSLLWFHHN